MSDIPFHSKKIESELRYLDATCALRLLDHYERCPEDWKLDFVAALVSSLLVSRARTAGNTSA